MEFVRRARGLGLVLVGLLVGMLLVRPATAHLTQNTRHLGVHAWRQVIKQKVYTRKQANNRFLRDAPGAVGTQHIGDDAVTGAKVDESTLGPVPEAGKLVGRDHFLIKLSAGEEQPIASHGPVSLTAACADVGPDRRVRIYASTTENGAILHGTDLFRGTAGDTLNTDTPSDGARLHEFVWDPVETRVIGRLDRGFVMTPDGSMLAIDGETLAMGVNFAGADCILVGVVEAIG